MVKLGHVWHLMLIKSYHIVSNKRGQRKSLFINEFNDNEREMVYSALTVSLYSPQLWGVFDER